MTFDEFDKAICKFLPYGSTCQYGEIGTEKLQVLVPHKDQIICAGELIYRFWGEGLYAQQPEIISTFACACGDFYAQLSPSQKNFRYLREKLDVPSLHFYNNNLFISRPINPKP